MPKARKPRPLTPAQKKLALKRSGRKRLSLSKADRRALRKFTGETTVFQALGGRPAGVTAKSASRHRVRARAVIYEKTKGKPEISEVWIPEHKEYNRFTGLMEVVSGRYERKRIEGSVIRKPVGEKLKLKRVKKKGQGKSGGGGGKDRGISHRTGTSQARRSAAKKKAAKRRAARVGGKRGGKPKSKKEK